jgi:hypothetical protein
VKACIRTLLAHTLLILWNHAYTLLLISTTLYVCIVGVHSSKCSAIARSAPAVPSTRQHSPPRARIPRRRPRGRSAPGPQIGCGRAQIRRAPQCPKLQRPQSCTVAPATPAVSAARTQPSTAATTRKSAAPPVP